MKENNIYNKIPEINFVRKKREQLFLQPLNIDLLFLQTGSTDPNVSLNAKQELLKNWEILPEFESNNAESVNIVDQISQFNNNDLKKIFKNLVAIQLTEGCNGNCGFCMFGEKKGVTKKYSFESIIKLFDKYEELMKENPFLLYWNSDPFDYRDRSFNFLDVYKLYKERLPENTQYISTALPKGGINDFIKFMESLIFESYSSDSKFNKTPIRVSVSLQNIQRVEYGLSKLTSNLINYGLTLNEIGKFYSNTLTIIGRFDNWILPLGKSIVKADSIKDTFSVACRDGVVISPKSCDAIIMTASTIYEPSGQKNIQLTNNINTQSYIPIKVRDEIYSRFKFGTKTLFVKTNSRNIILPVIKNSQNHEYSLENQIENQCLKLGREVASYVRLLHDLSALNNLKIESNDPIKEKGNYLKIVSEILRERFEYTKKVIFLAKKILNKNNLQKEEFDMLNYYINLSEIYLLKTNLIIKHINNKKSLESISKVSKTLLSIGKNEIDNLQNIIETLTKELI